MASPEEKSRVVLTLPNETVEKLRELMRAWERTQVGAVKWMIDHHHRNEMTRPNVEPQLQHTDASEGSNANADHRR